jgi:hypothetical protein
VSLDDIVPEPGYVQSDVLPVNPPVEKSMAGTSHRVPPLVGTQRRRTSSIIAPSSLVCTNDKKDTSATCSVPT